MTMMMPTMMSMVTMVMVMMMMIMMMIVFGENGGDVDAYVEYDVDDDVSSDADTMSMLIRYG